MIYKKGVSPLVATALLLVVTVISVVGFNSWYNNMSGSLFTDIEIESSTSTGKNNINLESLIANILFIQSDSTENVSINKLMFNNIDCVVDKNLSKGMNKINVSNCLENLSLTTIDIIKH